MVTDGIWLVQNVKQLLVLIKTSNLLNKENTNKWNKIPKFEIITCKSYAMSWKSSIRDPPPNQMKYL